MVCPVVFSVGWKGFELSVVLVLLLYGLQTLMCLGEEKPGSSGRETGSYTSHAKAKMCNSNCLLRRAMNNLLVSMQHATSPCTVDCKQEKKSKIYSTFFHLFSQESNCSHCFLVSLHSSQTPHLSLSSYNMKLNKTDYILAVEEEWRLRLNSTKIFSPSQEALPQKIVPRQATET